MRDFNFKAEYQKLLTPEVVAYLTQIHEYKGKQNLFIEAKADALSNLLEVAKIQSTEASNRIEGIITTDDRLKKIVREKTMPQSRSEKEIAGYRDVLATIHESHDYIPPKPTVILQLHRDLYKFSGKSIGGSFKNSDNVIAEERPDGRKIVARGECPGEILFAPQGTGGFGYDPVFFLPELGKTYAELTPAEKNAISHRARALQAFCRIYQEELEHDDK